MTAQRAFLNTFKIISTSEGLKARLISADHRDMMSGFDLAMDYTLDGLKHEIEHHPAYLRLEFGFFSSPDKHPDIILLKAAKKALIEKQIR